MPSVSVDMPRPSQWLTRHDRPSWDGGKCVLSWPSRDHKRASTHMTQLRPLCIALILGAASPAATTAAVLEVPQVFPSIPAALQSAQPGDTVLIAAGFYIVSHDVFADASGKSVEIQGSGAASTIILVPGGAGIFATGPVAGPPLVISHISFRGAGEGTLHETLLVSRSVFLHHCEFGPMGSVRLLPEDGFIQLLDCSFVGRWDPGVTASVNPLPSGPRLLVDGCLFENMDLSGSDDLQAAALRIDSQNSDPGAVVVKNCWFVCNSCGRHGALSGHPSLVESSVFVGNTGTLNGGGIGLWSPGPDVYPVIVDSCAFYGNSASIGGALSTDGNILAAVSDSKVSNNVADFAAGIFSLGPLFLSSSDFCGNTPDDVVAGGLYGTGNSFDPDCGADCDGDGVPDVDAIAIGLAQDSDLDGIPDECEPAFVDADLNGDCLVDGYDLGLVLASWGNSGGVADITADGTVDGADLAAVLGHWTPGV